MDITHFTKSDIGRREEMQDYYYNNVSIDKMEAFFGVYDGHGTKIPNIVAETCSTTLYKDLMVNDYYIQGKYEKALVDTFENFDKRFKNIKYVGSTAVVVLIVYPIVYVANLGDSRCIISNEDNIILLTKDHKPNDYIERLRIQQSGHYIINGRIDATINLTRAFGDYDFKTNGNDDPSGPTPMISSPDLYTLNLETGERINIPNTGLFGLLDGEPLTKHYDKTIEENVNITTIFKDLGMELKNPNHASVGGNISSYVIILGSDGIFDVIKNEVLVEYIWYMLQIGLSTKKITNLIINYCILKQSMDNLTITVIVINQPKLNKHIKKEYDESNILLKELFHVYLKKLTKNELAQMEGSIIKSFIKADTKAEKKNKFSSPLPIEFRFYLMSEWLQKFKVSFDSKLDMYLSDDTPIFDDDDTQEKNILDDTQSTD